MFSFHTITYQPTSVRGVSLSIKDSFRKARLTSYRILCQNFCQCWFTHGVILRRILRRDLTKYHIKNVILVFITTYFPQNGIFVYQWQICWCSSNAVSSKSNKRVNKEQQLLSLLSIVNPEFSCNHIVLAMKYPKLDLYNSWGNTIKSITYTCMTTTMFMVV